MLDVKHADFRCDFSQQRKIIQCMYFLSHGTLWQRKKNHPFFIENWKTFLPTGDSGNRAELWFYKDDHNSRALLFHARRD